MARGCTATSTVARIDKPSICESSGRKSHTPNSMLELPGPAKIKFVFGSYDVLMWMCGHACYPCTCHPLSPCTDTPDSML